MPGYSNSDVRLIVAFALFTEHGYYDNNPDNSLLGIVITYLYLKTYKPVCKFAPTVCAKDPKNMTTAFRLIYTQEPPKLQKYSYDISYIRLNDVILPHN